MPLCGLKCCIHAMDHSASKIYIKYGTLCMRVQLVLCKLVPMSIFRSSFFRRDENSYIYLDIFKNKSIRREKLQFKKIPRNLNSKSLIKSSRWRWREMLGESIELAILKARTDKIVKEFEFVPTIFMIFESACHFQRFKYFIHTFNDFLNKAPDFFLL